MGTFIENLEIFGYVNHRHQTSLGIGDIRQKKGYMELLNTGRVNESKTGFVKQQLTGFKPLRKGRLHTSHQQPDKKPW
jgi:hypothetical protein